MQTILLAGYPAHAGKTTIAAALAARLRSEGATVAYLKPVLFEAPASVTLARQEATALAAGLGIPAVAVANQDATGSAPAELDGPRRALLTQALQQHADRDVVLVEAPGVVGAGGSVAAEQYAEALDARVLVVARYRNGLDAATIRRAVQPFGDRLLGVVLNAVPASFAGYASERLIPELAGGNVRVWAVVGIETALQLPTIGQLADALDGRILNDDDKRDELIEHLLIGARSWDPASPYLALKSGFAFITRSDLMDVQLAAINDTTRCIVLTNGGNPATTVRYRAEEAGIPIVVVPDDTVTAVKRLDEAMRSLGFTQAGKVSHSLAALERRGDLAGLASAVRTPA